MLSKNLALLVGISVCATSARAQFAEGVSFPSSLASKTVKLNETGKRIPAILDDIEKSTGIFFSNSPSLNNEVVMALINNMPTDEFLIRLAKLTGSEWTIKDDGYRLVRDKPQTDKAWAQDRPEVLKSIQEQLDGRRKYPFTLPKKDEIARMIEGWKDENGTVNNAEFMNSMGIYEFAASKLQSAISANDLIDLKVGSRKLFGSITMPNSFSLSPKMIQAQNEAQKLIADATKIYDDALPGAPIEVQRISRIDYKIDHSAPGKFKIVCWMHFRNGKRIGPRTEVVNVVEPAMNSIFQAMARSVELSESAGVSEPEPQKVKWPFQPVRADRIVDLSKVALAQYSLSRLFGGAAGQDEDVYRSLNLEGLWSGTRDPDLKDPLSFMPGEMLRGIAMDQGKEMMVLVPDKYATINFFQFMVGGTVQGLLPKLTVKSCFDSLESSTPMDIVTEGKLITMKPKLPSLTSMMRMDRVALRKLFDSEKVNQGLTLGAQIQFATSFPDYSPMKDFSYLTLYLESGGFSQTGMTGFSFRGLRFLGSLSPAQWGITTDTGILYGELSAGQKALCNDVIFNTGDDTDMFFGGSEFNGAELSGDGISTFDLLARGIPSNMILKGKWDEKIIARVVEFGATPIPMSFISAEEVAQYQMMKDQPESQMFADLLPKTDRLKPALSRNFSIQMILGDEQEVKQLYFNERFVTGPVCNYDQMPPAFLKEVEEALKRYKRGGDNDMPEQVVEPGK